jgi:nitrogen-specific signal transduction histidine kinase/CheY-like chemotaxis protein
VPRFESEQELKQLRAERDAALALAAARSDLVAHVSHDIRSPLNGVLGMAQLLLESDLDSDQREFAELINTSAEALLTLINDLLDHSKIEAGKLSIDSAAFDLRHAVGETVRTLELQARDKDLALTLDVATAVPTMVVGDPGRIRQILFNLIGNAIKFTHEGSIKVSIDVDSVKDATTVLRFGVTDTGVGMTPEQAAAIFLPFEQADAEVFRQYGGTGLGLAISRRLADMMKGDMWVESTPGAGSTFWFTVELSTRIDEATADSGLPASREQLDIVVVTDSRRRAVLNGLAGAQVRVVRVATAAQAAAALAGAIADRPAHIAVMDFREEGLEGPRVAMPAAGDAKVMVLTPAGQRGDAAVCRKLGISAYLTGSVSGRDVSAAVDAIVDGVPALITRHWLREQAYR